MTCSWHDFADAEGWAIEEAFCDPSRHEWCGVVDSTGGYPFGGSVAVHFFLNWVFVRGRPAHELRCVRAAPPATTWMWYYLSVQHQPMLAEFWTEVPRMLRDELEQALVDKQSHLFVRKLPCSILHQLPPFFLDFVFDVNNMTATTNNKQQQYTLELVRRPMETAKDVDAEQTKRKRMRDRFDC